MRTRPWFCGGKEWDGAVTAHILGGKAGKNERVTPLLGLGIQCNDAKGGVHFSNKNFQFDNF